MAKNKTRNLKASKKAENDFSSQLKKVSKIVHGIIDSHIVDGLIDDEYSLNKTLQDYSNSLESWAKRITSNLLNVVNTSNKKKWASYAKDLRADLRRVLNKTDVGAMARLLQDEQVNLIKSLPIEAGMKAQEISRQAILDGTRAEESAKKIKNLGAITSRRAVLIARTETAKANAAMNQARSLSVGSDSYIWRAVEDADTRETHAELDGTVQRWADPPVIDGEGAHHPGDIWNCRCWAEPIF